MHSKDVTVLLLSATALRSQSALRHPTALHLALDSISSWGLVAFICQEKVWADKRPDERAFQTRGDTEPLAL